MVNYGLCVYDGLKKYRFMLILTAFGARAASWFEMCDDIVGNGVGLGLELCRYQAIMRHET